MKTATITEAQDELGALIELVRGGETVVITDEGRPVARLVPAAGRDDDEARLERLERAGVIKRGTGKPVKLDPLPDPIVPVGGVEALLEERRQGW